MSRLKELGSLKVETLLSQEIIKFQTNNQNDLIPFVKLAITDNSKTMLEISAGQIDHSPKLNGIGRKIKITIAEDSSSKATIQIEEGLFTQSQLYFGRIIDNNQTQIGLFKYSKLHGKGKRINPN